MREIAQEWFQSVQALRPLVNYNIVEYFEIGRFDSSSNNQLDISHLGVSIVRVLMAIHFAISFVFVLFLFVQLFEEEPTPNEPAT
jgi:hypothetical protein